MYTLSVLLPSSPITSFSQIQCGGARSVACSKANHLILWSSKLERMELYNGISSTNPPRIIPSISSIASGSRFPTAPFFPFLVDCLVSKFNPSVSDNTAPRSICCVFSPIDIEFCASDLILFVLYIYLPLFAISTKISTYIRLLMFGS